MTVQEGAQRQQAPTREQRVLALFALLLGAITLFNRPFFSHLLGTWGPVTWVVPLVTAVAALDYAVYAWLGDPRTSSGAVTAVGAALLLGRVLGRDQSVDSPSR